MSECKHKKCDICLKPACIPTCGPLREFAIGYGETKRTLRACDPCIKRAVRFAYDAVCTFGGSGEWVCGYPAPSAPQTEQAVQP